MRAAQLLARAATHMHKYSVTPVKITAANLFTPGAWWMYGRMREIGRAAKPFPPGTSFLYYGLLKYGISLSAFFVSALLLLKWSVLFLWVAVLVFYILEVHFLFLFPLLIDGVANPVFSSIRLTYKAGFLSSLLTVTGIGLFMMAGLMNIKQPAKNWYIGCLAVVLWYNDEAGNRV